MCKAASFVVTRNDVLFSEKSDSHEDIIRENKLDDSDINFVRVEISPSDNDYKLPFDKWKFFTDQSYVPDWYNDENAENACRDKLPIWAKFHIFTKDSNHASGNLSLIFLAGKHIVRNLTGGYVWAYDTSTVQLSGQTGGDVWAYGTSTVRSSGQTGGHVLAYGTSTVRSSGQTGGHVKAYDTSTVRSLGQTGGEVLACDTSTVRSSGQSGGEVWALGGIIITK